MRTPCLLACLLVTGALAEPIPVERPNVVIIVADDLGYADCGVQGGSDNGGPITRNAPNHSSNGDLRGAKGETWEGGIRVPLFMSWPQRLPAGSVRDEPVWQMDQPATALALAGATPDPAWPLDGRNLWPTLTEREAWRRSIGGDYPADAIHPNSTGLDRP